MDNQAGKYYKLFYNYMLMNIFYICTYIHITKIWVEYYMEIKQFTIDRQSSLVDR